GGEAEGAPQGREAQDAGAESGSATVQAVPGRLDSLKWPLLGGFAVVFGLLAYLLSRKTVVAVGGGAVAAKAVPAGKSKKPKGQPPPAPPSASSPAGKAPSNGPASLSVVDAAIGTSLDALKRVCSVWSCGIRPVRSPRKSTRGSARRPRRCC